MVAPSPLARASASRPLRGVVLSAEFLMLYASWLLATTALLVPLVFLPTFARTHGVEPVAASALVSILGGMGILGRVGIGALTKRIGSVHLFKISVFVMAISYLLWLPFTAYGWLLAFAALLGLGYGVRISLMPVVLIEFFGLGNLGAVLGAFFTASGVSALCGPLLAGLVVDYTGSYQWGITFALAVGVLGFLVVVPLQPHRAAGADAGGAAAPR
jgi:MFS family permease